MGDGVGGEFHLEQGEVLHHDRGEISILAELEKILLVQCVHVTF